jgi:tRNA pseudouridine38-40 synthase
MVRNLVGTFLEVGRGNLKDTDIPAILEARSRDRAGPTAPARGLFLVNVDYVDE